MKGTKGAVIKVGPGEKLPKGFRTLPRVGSFLLVEELERLPGGGRRKRPVARTKLVEIVPGEPGRLVLEILP